MRRQDQHHHGLRPGAGVACWESGGVWHPGCSLPDGPLRFPAAGRSDGGVRRHAQWFVFTFYTELRGTLFSDSWTNTELLFLISCLYLGVGWSMFGLIFSNHRDPSYCFEERSLGTNSNSDGRLHFCKSSENVQLMCVAVCRWWTTLPLSENNAKHSSSLGKQGIGYTVVGTFCKLELLMFISQHYNNDSACPLIYAILNYLTSADIVNWTGCKFPFFQYKTTGGYQRRINSEGNC